MKNNKLACLFGAVFTLSPMVFADTCSVESMAIIGEKEFITVQEIDSVYRARIDTGATRSSLHATNIEVIDGYDDLRANVGKQVRFVTENELGEYHQYEAPIVSVRSIKNSLGSDIRYSVDLTIVKDDYARTLQVNLRDRSSMNDKLLIGRDWLECQYLVDVSQNPTKENQEIL
ncbi:RimK/LysX family protein [Vibrio sp. WXL103]|uniref:putative ATP-dependent zinc protease n=1 Tax=Vibrio sp. WXL103 TaxID=3450710 RepID=UPI003EC5A63F